jgi:DNA-binding MarR family transcriptional regulator
MSDEDRFVSAFQEWIDLFMHRSMCRFLDYARSSGLSMSMIGALFHLNQREKTGVTDLGAHLGVTSAATSQMLDRLVGQDLIERLEDPDDRRGKQITLTEKGCQVLEEGLRARQGWLIELADKLTESEKEHVASALDLMINKARQID